MWSFELQKPSVDADRLTGLLPILEETEEDADDQLLHFEEDHYEDPAKTGFDRHEPDQPDFQRELDDLAEIEQDFFSFVLPWLKLIPEGASVPLEEVRRTSGVTWNGVSSAWLVFLAPV